MDVWRWVEHDPIDLDRDFESAIQEHQRYGVTNLEVWELPGRPCDEHGVSVHDTKEKSQEKLQALQDGERHSLDKGGDRQCRFLKKRVQGLALLSGAGAIVLTGKKSRHMEWWPANDFKKKIRLHEEDDR